MDLKQLVLLARSDNRRKLAICVTERQIKQFALPSDDKPDHNHEPDGDEEDQSANNLIAGEAHRRKWHGRPARDATRKMRVPHQL